MRHISVLQFILCTLLISGAWASSNYIVYVGPPNGADDTAICQAALDNCMTSHPTGCTIQLSAGTYLSQQLIAEDFHGSFQGMGMGVTTIEVLAPLVVTVSNENVQNNPPSRTNKYPVLLLFTGGEITVSDLTFKVSAYNPTTPWCYGGAGCGQTWLEAPLGVIGSSASLLVQRVGFEGAPGQIDGFTNYNNGVLFWGVERPAQPLVGTLKLVSSRINHSANGFEVWGVRDSQSIIGGSPANGNVFEDSELGGVFLDVDHSLIEYSHNNVTLAPDLPYNGLSILQGVLWMPQKPAQFFIQHNTIRVKGGFENGILILDRGPLFGVGKTGNFLIADNAIQLGGSESNPAYAGIESIFAVDAVISNNKISGEGALMGISAEASLHCTLKANNVQQLRPILFPVALLGVNSGFAWNTSDCTVVGGNNKTNIYDEGTSNTLVGVNNMQGNPPGPAFREARQQKRDLRKMLHR